MSKFVKVRTELRNVELVKQALDDLRLVYEENVRYHHLYSGANEVAALLVRAPEGVPSASGPMRRARWKIMGDSMQLTGVKQTLQRIQQRYAYHMVVQETTRAGFAVVEEQTGRDQVIRMTVRRWNRRIKPSRIATSPEIATNA